MKQLLSTISIFAGLTIACNSNDNKPSNITVSELMAKPDILETLQQNKSKIDTIFNYSKDKIIELAKLEDRSEPVLIKNDNLPDNVETSYTILKDSLGKIISVSESPFSKSGDWFMIFTHYFDNNGKTFAFERQTNFFNSICTDGVAYETITEYYNSDFGLVEKEYELTDENNKVLQKDSCQLPYEYKYTVSTNLEEYLKIQKINENKWK